MDYIKEAILEAEKALEEEEVPIGAIIVKDNKIIARAHNKKEQLNDVTRHAEIIAIQNASKSLGDWRLNECDMYVTLEPCIMCMGAIIQSRISKLYIGTFNQEMGACGSIINLSDNRKINCFVNTIWCNDVRCSELLSQFFESRRR